jgi:hypothetical protein
MDYSLPSLGIRFDINKISSSDYGGTCWKLFWGIIDIHKLRGALLFEGDTSGTAYGKENVYCIAIQTTNDAILDDTQTALEENPDFQKLAALPRFARGNSVVQEPLIATGQVDASGELIGGINSKSALEAIKREKRDQPLAFSDPELNPFKSMLDIDRPALGLRPLPIKAEIRILRKVGQDAQTAKYDAVVNIWDGFMLQSAFFRLVGNKFEWIGEKEKYYGPNQVKTEGGWGTENITINYFVEPIANEEKGYSVKYFGDNKQLASKQPLTIDDARPELSIWGAKR